MKRSFVAVSHEAQRRWPISLISQAYAKTRVTSCDGADVHIVFALSLDDIDGIDVARIPSLNAGRRAAGGT